MRPRSLCWIGLLQTQYCAPAHTSTGRFVASIALLLAPVVAEETCSVDAGSGEEVCKSQQAEGAPHAQDAAKASDEPHILEDSSDDKDSDVSEDDDSEDDDTLTYEEEDEEADDGRPVWWRYSIDELFEDLWNCGEIVYGYDVQEEEDQVENQDDEANPAKTSEDANSSTEVSEAQIRFLQQQWHTIREKYVREVHLVPIVHEELKDSLSNAETGDTTTTTAIPSRGISQLVVPNRVGDAGPHKGRGVYATKPIPKGTLVSDLDNGSTGIFKDGHSWREFAATLPRMTACNFIEWSWVQTVPPAHEGDDDLRNGLTIFVAFDESNLLNSADWDGIEANVRCGTPPSEEGGERGPCRFQYYAARDIDAGEELLIDYGEFEDLSQQGWTDIGL